MIDYIQVFTFLFLMLGPFKVIGPFAKITQGADPVLIRRIAVRAILFSCGTVLAAAILGGLILSRFGIPLPILGISGGIILFLVALLNIIQMYTPLETQPLNAGAPTLKMAFNPLAFPTIVTPYGIAAVIVILAYCPDIQSKLIFGAIVFGIMALNLVIMLVTRYIFKFLAVFLAILGTILGVVQVALGLQIIYKQMCMLLKLG